MIRKIVLAVALMATAIPALAASNPAAGRQGAELSDPCAITSLIEATLARAATACNPT